MYSIRVSIDRSKVNAVGITSLALFHTNFYIHSSLSPPTLPCVSSTLSCLSYSLIQVSVSFHYYRRRRRRTQKAFLPIESTLSTYPYSRDGVHASDTDYTFSLPPHHPPIPPGPLMLTLDALPNDRLVFTYLIVFCFTYRNDLYFIRFNHFSVHAETISFVIFNDKFYLLLILRLIYLPRYSLNRRYDSFFFLHENNKELLFA